MQHFDIERAAVFHIKPAGCEVVYLGGEYGSADDDCEAQATVWKDTATQKFTLGYITGNGVLVMLTKQPQADFNAAVNKAEEFTLVCCGEAAKAK